MQLILAKDVFGAVYDFTDFPGLSCAFLTGPAMLAEGAANVITTDNDVFVSGTRTNTFRVKTNGTLDLVDDNDDDGSTNLNQHFHAQISKQDFEFIVLQSDIKLSSDPR